MANLIVALLSVQGVVSGVLGLDVDQQALVQGLGLNTADDYTMFADDVKTKTSEEEQAVLKTLLDKRAHWHPEAESLFKDVLKRPSPSARRLSKPGAVGDHCDANTKALCTSMVDSQCQPCRWDDFFESCYKNKCGDYSDTTKCCANAKNIATGCMWNVARGKCFERTCGEATYFTGTPTYSSPDTAWRAAQIASCKAQTACTLVCETEQAGKRTAGFCKPGPAADWECDTTLSPSADSKKPKVKDPSNTDIFGSECNIIDCSICLKNKNCAAKKTKVKDTTKDGCSDKCSKLAPDDATVECLFCGPKAAGCTPLQATPDPSCAAMTATITPAPIAACDTICKDAAATCSTMGTCKGPAGLVNGAVGLTATIVGVLALVCASMLV